MPVPEPEGFVVWRLGQALLAARVADVVETVPLTGGAVEGQPDLELVRVAGLEPEVAVRLAVVVRVPDGRVALPAEAVEGVLSAGPAHITPPPPWLGRVAREAVTGLIRLADERVAAVVDVAAVGGG